jgi:hypothetical protein
MTSPVTLTTTTTPTHTYSVHLEGLLTTVLINPLFTLQNKAGVTMIGAINTNGTQPATSVVANTSVRPAIALQQFD